MSFSIYRVLPIKNEPVYEYAPHDLKLKLGTYHKADHNLVLQAIDSCKQAYKTTEKIYVSIFRCNRFFLILKS